MDPYIGEIRLFGFNYAPMDWQVCDGSLLPIQQFAALFAVIGATYGGNGQTNFALPDLRGRVPMAAGAGAFPNPGQVGGAETVTLQQAQTPSHSHTLACKTLARGKFGNEAPTASSVFSTAGASAYASGTPTIALAPGEMNALGGGAAHENRMPSLGMNFCICINGSFPPHT